MTSTSPLFGLLIPSIKTKNSVFNLRDASFQCQERAVSMESISSMKMMLGAICSAAQKTFLIIFSDSPTSLFMMEEAEREKNVQFDSLARALQIQVLPFPGGPQRSIPLGGALIPMQRSGLCRGRMTASSRIALTYLSPTISLKETSNFLMISSYMAGSSYTFFRCFSNRGLRLSLAENFLGKFYQTLRPIRSAFFFSEPTSIVLFPCLGKPSFVIFMRLAYFSDCLYEAYVFFSMYLAIFSFMASMLSFEVACEIAYFKSKMIFSQQRMAYYSLPSERKESALAESSLASCSFSMSLDQLQ